MPVHVERKFPGHGYDVYVYGKVDGGTNHLQPNGEWFFAGNFAPWTDIKPTFHVADAHAQDLITGLQAAGVHPPALTKIEGLYEAQSRHLEDLQSILRNKKLLG